MQFQLGLTPSGEFCVSVEARVLTPLGSETLHWSALFENEAPFLRRVVTSALPQHQMALILTGVIRAIAEPPGSSCPAVELELNDALFYALGLGEGECVALKAVTAFQRP